MRARLRFVCEKNLFEGDFTMKKILVDDGFDPGEVKTVIIGPCNDRPNATKLGNNQSITQEEADALLIISAKSWN